MRWEIVEKKFKCLYKIRELVPGEIFGHDEMIEHFYNILNQIEGVKKIAKRNYRVVAEEQTDLFYLNLAQFYLFFTDAELKKMKDHIIEIDT